jgi:hypothetical protein
MHLVPGLVAACLQEKSGQRAQEEFQFLDHSHILATSAPVERVCV